MRLWFAHSSEVPIYRQLVTQIVLAIHSGDLKPGDRLPSTRELARRFALHPNTVSAGYRQLEKEGWTERRRGSGITIRGGAEPPHTAEQQIDHHIAGFFRAARELGLPAEAVRARVREWLDAPPPDHFLLVDPDAELRRILITELAACTSWRIAESTPQACCDDESLTAAIVLCRPSQQKTVRAALPKGVEVVTLPIRSPNTWLSPWLPAPKGHLVGIVSHWPEFLDRAQTMLIAAGLSTDTLLFRDARKRGWPRGLEQATVILYDSYTASLPTLPQKPFHIVFPLLADSAAAELCQFTREPVQMPKKPTRSKRLT
ncbi:MAG TPA: GntR family transcriptional regulator [Acidobacteriaceae bacterium]|nr:GntR family transcriptional regulator [Acidobacteriaceae bacterium]